MSVQLLIKAVRYPKFSGDTIPYFYFAKNRNIDNDIDIYAENFLTSNNISNYQPEGCFHMKTSS